MTKRVLNEYRRIFRSLRPLPRAALEVGALPTHRGLLSCEELRHVPRKIGINIRESGSYAGVPVIVNDARRLAFKDRSFDLVVCSSTLEHVPEFWTVCEEMKRVLAPGGLLIVNTPGFTKTRSGDALQRLAFKLHLPDVISRATLTFRMHEEPHDYYRFSAYTFWQVILRGLVNVKVWTIMTPPRIFGMGRRPLG